MCGVVEQPMAWRRAGPRHERWVGAVRGGARAATPPRLPSSSRDWRGGGGNARGWRDPPRAPRRLRAPTGFFPPWGVCVLHSGGVVVSAARPPRQKKASGDLPECVHTPPLPLRQRLADQRGAAAADRSKECTLPRPTPPPPPQVSDPGRCVSSLRLVRVRRRTGRARRLSLDHPASGWNWWTAPAVAAGRVHRPFCQATPLGPSRAAPPPPSQPPPLCSLPHSFSDKPKHLWATAPRLIQHPFSLRRVVVVVDAGAGLLGHHRSVGVAPQPRDGPTE